MIDIVIHGAGGRMGRAVAETAGETDDFRVVGGVSESPEARGVPGWSGAELVTELADLEADYDVVVDFSSPAGAIAAAQAARARGRALVTGTTGLSAEQDAVLRRVAGEVAVVAAPNFSVGITMLLDLVERTAAALGPGADVEVLEAHHRHKADAPSGTALRLGEAVAARRGQSLDDVARYERRTEDGPRAAGSIGFASLRAGDIVGEHQVLFAIEGERVELGHRASDRRIFARGALRAARWVRGRSPGLYDMRDVLGL